MLTPDPRLAYTPARSGMDGSYRRASVTVKGKGLTAVHRSGYWAVVVP